MAPKGPFYKAKALDGNNSYKAKALYSNRLASRAKP